MNFIEHSFEYQSQKDHEVYEIDLSFNAGNESDYGSDMDGSRGVISWSYLNVHFDVFKDGKKILQNNNKDLWKELYSYIDDYYLFSNLKAA